MRDSVDIFFEIMQEICSGEFFHMIKCSKMMSISALTQSCNSGQPPAPHPTLPVSVSAHYFWFSLLRVANFPALPLFCENCDEQWQCVNVVVSLFSRRGVNFKGERERSCRYLISFSRAAKCTASAAHETPLTESARGMSRERVEELTFCGSELTSVRIWCAQSAFPRHWCSCYNVCVLSGFGAICECHASALFP